MKKEKFNLNQKFTTGKEKDFVVIARKIDKALRSK